MSEELKNKLQDFEVQPPAEVWTKISTELTEANPFLPLADKMYSFEVMPPAVSWTYISESLRKADHQPIKTTRSLGYKFAVAAAFIGVLLMGSLFFLFRGSTTEKVARVKKTNITHDIPATPEPEQTEEQPLADQEPAASRELYASNEDRPVTRTNISRSPQRALRKADISNALFTAQTHIMVPAKPIRNAEGDIIQDLANNGDDEYITVTGPNGQQTRISSKFLHALVYLNQSDFENNFDGDYYESESWQKKFQDWRKKIMQTSFIPSSTNFLDILEFKDLIMKDNNQ
jgi:hypothetical protein